ncbi:MAG: hypothetical protein ACJAVK_000820 [Akkermansiaceae bacterium]|jgi:hypothetical protein
MKSILIIIGYLLSLVSAVSAAPAVIKLLSPLDYQVVQRNSPFFGRVPVMGELAQAAAKGTSLEARFNEEGWQELVKIEEGERRFYSVTRRCLGEAA